MNLTPIRIPGKNRRNQTRAAVEAGRNSSEKKEYASTSVLSYGSARNGSSPASSVDSSVARPAKRRKGLRHLKSRRKMTLLEKLPTELLEAVFLFCLNCNLPRASPVIAGKLSSQHLYVKSLCTAFGPSWDASFDLSHRGFRVEDDCFPPSQAYESALLQCRWATLDIWKKAESAWLRNRAESTPSRDQAPPTSTEAGLETPRWLARYEDVFFEQDFRDFLEWSMEDCRSTDIFPLLSTGGKWTGLLRINPKTDVPDHLLRGPWTKQMLKHLFALARAGATVNFERSTSGEVAMEGIEVAVGTGSRPALFLLHAVGCRNCVTIDLFKKAAYRQEQHGRRQVTDSMLRQLMIMMQRPEHLDKLGLTIRRMRTEPPANWEDKAWTSWMDHLHGTLLDFLM